MGQQIPTRFLPSTDGFQFANSWPDRRPSRSRHRSAALASATRRAACAAAWSSVPSTSGTPAASRPPAGHRRGAPVPLYRPAAHPVLAHAGRRGQVLLLDEPARHRCTAPDRRRGGAAQARSRSSHNRRAVAADQGRDRRGPARSAGRRHRRLGESAPARAQPSSAGVCLPGRWDPGGAPGLRPELRPVDDVYIRFDTGFDTAAFDTAGPQAEAPRAVFTHSVNIGWPVRGFFRTAYSPATPPGSVRPPR